jgi:multidrug efflux pump subunit AcrA (membrane-fusion protein)
MRSADHDSSAVPNQDDSKVAVLEQVLWKRLGETTELEVFLQTWIRLLCRRLSGAEYGLVLIARDAQFVPVAMWPEGGSATVSLAATLETALSRRQGAARLNPDATAGNSRGAVVALPILFGDRLCGAVGLELCEVDDTRLRDVMRQLQWGIGWVRDRLRQREVEEERQIALRSRVALDLIAGVAEDPESGMAARRAATELAGQFRCTRVSLGWMHRGSIQVGTISHSAFVDRRMAVVRRLSAAMDEAADQQAMLLYPTDKPLHALRAHRDLAEAEGSTVLTIPLLQHDHICGALLCERSKDQPFEQQDVLTLDAIAGLLGAVLNEKRQNDRWIVVKLWEALVNQLRLLFGPAHFGQKLSVVAAAAILMLLAVANGEYTINAEGQLQGKVRRAIVAQFDGYLKQAPFRAGDVVQEGEMLASLDERDLTFERLRWVTERQQRLQEYERSMASRDRAAAGIAQAQIAQAEAQIHLTDTQLERTVMLAPFDGVVVSGDHTQSIGGAVKRGEVLFEVSPLDQYRLDLNVDEMKIADLRVGQRGIFIATALPYSDFDFVINRITPITEVTEGHSVFRVEGNLRDAPRALRPGMKGFAKVDIDRRRLVWIWAHSLLDYLRLFAWKWLA